MKVIHILYAMLLFFVSCKPRDAKDVAKNNIPEADSSNQNTMQQAFFPVTDYIKGQIFEIKNSAVNPLKIENILGHTDSSWIKIETLDHEMADFLSPEIDTANLRPLFSEEKFMDQTLDAITFTYDPIKPLPDTFSLQHWDVYVDPNTNHIKSIYLLKKLPGKKTQQLTWVAGKSCHMVTILNGENGSFSIEKEITLTWRF